MASYSPVPPAPPVYGAVNQPGYEPFKPYNPPVHAFDIDQVHPNPHHNHHPVPPRTTSRQSFKDAFGNLWLFELFCWLFTLGCFIAIIVILIAFNEKPVPKWMWGITLPTVISLLSSVATFFLAVPIDEGLGQLKWLWFRRTRPLADFETFNDAASGPPGSAMLLIKLKGGPLAFFGALLTLLLLAISPLVQQILSTSLHEVPKNEASLPVAMTYLNNTNTVDVDLSMKEAVMTGMLTTSNNSSPLFQMPAQCPTGNCTWPIYTSLAIRGHCSDLTSKLTIQSANTDTNYSLPNGVSLLQDPIAIGVSMVVNNTWPTPL